MTFIPNSIIVCVFTSILATIFIVCSLFGISDFICLQKEESLPAFQSPHHAIAKTLLQLAGEFDFEDTFNKGDLLYTPTTYILFITFLITMPILFINLLVSCCCMFSTLHACLSHNMCIWILVIAFVLIQFFYTNAGLMLQHRTLD